MNPAIKFTSPIGIFDSGIGGLSHAKAIANYLPHQSLIYIGDIQHFPYGSKTQAEIQFYCLPIVEYLLKQNCKIIVIACNTATAAALPMIREFVGARALVLDVVSVIIDYAAEHFADQKLGLIATDYTIASQVYAKKLGERAPRIQLAAIATPQLIYRIETEINAPTAERTQSYDLLIKEYLSVEALQNIKALILGCTHYPFVKKQISHYYHNQMPLIDSATLIADCIVEKLKELPAQNIPSKRQFFCTQVSQPFSQAVRSFFEQEAELLELP
jgi:glutamate racemase